MSPTPSPNRTTTKSVYAALPLALGLLISACALDTQESTGEPVAETAAASQSTCEGTISAVQREQMFTAMARTEVELDDGTAAIIDALIDVHNESACDEDYEPEWSSVFNSFPPIGLSLCFYLKALHFDLDLAWQAARAGRDAAPNDLLPAFAELERQIADAQIAIQNQWIQSGCQQLLGNI